MPVPRMVFRRLKMPLNGEALGIRSSITASSFTSVVVAYEVTVDRESKGLFSSKLSPKEEITEEAGVSISTYFVPI